PEVARSEASPRPLEQDEPAAAVPSAGLDLVAVRRMWPEVLDAVKGMRRYTWTLLSHNAQVTALDGRRLVLGMQSAGARDRILAGGNDEIVRQALIDVLGVDWKVEAVVDGGAARGHGVVAPGPRGVTTPAPTPARVAPEPRPGVDLRRAPAAAMPVPSPVAGPGAEALPPRAPAVDEPSPDDPDLDEAGMTHLELLQRNLGARVIEEYETS
ncbi:MAG: DNA polymerase III subunit gamma and tau, partial [Actinomycetota bacterium]|nr:DNA polymerase III subunit gamma and tau [Actinomycetota bacterium]